MTRTLPAPKPDDMRGYQSTEETRRAEAREKDAEIRKLRALLKRCEPYLGYGPRASEEFVNEVRVAAGMKPRVVYGEKDSAAVLAWLREHGTKEGLTGIQISIGMKRGKRLAEPALSYLNRHGKIREVGKTMYRNGGFSAPITLWAVVEEQG